MKAKLRRVMKKAVEMARKMKGDWIARMKIALKVAWADERGQVGKEAKYSLEYFDSLRTNQNNNKISFLLGFNKTAEIIDEEGNILATQKNEVIEETEKAYKVKITVVQEDYENEFWLPKSKLNEHEDFIFTPGWVMRDKVDEEHLDKIVYLVDELMLDDYNVKEVKIK